MRTFSVCTRMFQGVIIILFSLAWAQTACAHVEGGQAAGFFTGLQHPWSGLDHVLAMVAVGLWGHSLEAPPYGSCRLHSP
jgi:hydrogenase/urease accessory protein HupE